MRRLPAIATLLLVALTGCAAEDAGPAPAGDPAPATRSADTLLAEHGLDGLATTEVVDRLDRLRLDERTEDLSASIRPDEVLVTAGPEELSLPVPDDLFYLSVAPYVDQTHDCFYHSPTTCTGELAAEDVVVELVDLTHDEVLVDETVTTFENGFVGFWLPRDIEGTLRVSSEGRVGEIDFSTDDRAPTCLTTLQLA